MCSHVHPLTPFGLSVQIFVKFVKSLYIVMKGMKFMAPGF